MRALDEHVSEIIPYPAHAVCVNASGIIFKGPCLVSAITVTGDGATAAVEVYDGTSDTGELKFKLNCLQNTTFNEILMHPTDFDRGIYVKVNAATTYVTIQYIPENPKYFL